MKKTARLLIIYILAQTGSLYAVCKSEACGRAVAWKRGYAAIVLDDDISRDDYFAVLETVKANSGVVAIEAGRVLLGWIPAPAAGKVRATPGVRALSYHAVARPADLVSGADALDALAFFNRVVSGAYEDGIETGLATAAAPLTGCGVLRPELLSQESESPLSYLSAHTAGGHIAPTYDFHTPYQNPDMRGRVTVQLFRMDSDGTLDPNSYTWTNADYGYTNDQVYGAFTFWVNEAAARNVTLSFRIVNMDPFSRYTRSYIPTPTRYEPILHSSNDDYLWVNDALTRYGYGASPVTRDNVYTQNETFNRDKKADPTYGPFDRSFSVYRVYNPGAAPSLFANGSNAYALFDGPFTTVMWNSGGWGPNNIGRVLTHETGHIFWACDEYKNGCFTCDSCFWNVGPRNHFTIPYIPNANCENNTNGYSCDVPLTTCIMKRNDYALCPHTPGQVGW